MLTSQDLKDMGLTPGPMFAKIFKAVKECKTKESALEIANAIVNGTFASFNATISVIEGSALDFLLSFPFCPSSQGGFASNAEKRRILENKAVIINGNKPGPNDIISFPLTELVFFPNSNKKVTIF
jgi:hypothetical protein